MDSVITQIRPVGPGADVSCPIATSKTARLELARSCFQGESRRFLVDPVSPGRSCHAFKANHEGSWSILSFFKANHEGSWSILSPVFYELALQALVTG